MTFKSLFLIDFFFEEIFLQLLLLSTALFTITTHSLFRKLWGFSAIILILGLILANLGYELYMSFLWLIELSFIIVFLLLIMSFNSSLKLTDTSIFSSQLKFFILFLIVTTTICIFIPIYFFYSGYYTSIKSGSFLNLISHTTYTDYYKENQPNGLVLSDLRGLGLALFNNNFISLLLFLLLLTIASILIVTIQLQASIKKGWNNKALMSNVILNRFKYTLNKGFMNKEVLEYQLKNKNGLRVIKYKKKYMSITKLFCKYNKFNFSTSFNNLYLDFFINKIYWKIDPILNTSWKLDTNNIKVTDVQDIRAARFWEKFRQGTNREQYRTGVHMINYLNLALFLAAYLRFNSSNLNLSKLSLLTVLLTVLVFIPIKKLVSIKNFLSNYHRFFLFFTK